MNQTLEEHAADPASTTEESSGDFLARLGDNAVLWAQEFNKTAVKLGHQSMDEEWLIGWFANAIEHSGDVRRWRKEKETTARTFGEAIEALKQGKRVAREGWNGKGMFLFLLPAGTVPKAAIHDPALRAVMDAEIEGDTFEALGSIRMFTADKKVLTGWLASQTDMLSEDWTIID